MRVGIVFLAALLGLTGCLSIGGGSSPPEKTTVIVPPGSTTTTCTNYNGTPCTPQ